MDEFVKNLVFTKSDKLLTDVETKWFEQKGIKPVTGAETFQPVKKIETLNDLREHARKLHEQDIANYNTFREQTRRSDQNWIKTVQRTGTTGDKISANCILVQDSAIHNLSALDMLMSSVKLSKKRECILAMDACRDLFVNYLLPKRALKSFNEQPFEHLLKITDPTLRDKQLLVWYFESLIKIKYSSFIKALQLAFADTLANTKFKVASVFFELISANQHEQHKLILETIINKLGDPDYHVASRIIYMSNNYVNAHPAMKDAVLGELERFAYRPNVNQRAQYYAFCCMNQFILNKQEVQVANRLLLIYFSFFKKFIKVKEIDSRMLSALLTGVNRAYKFAKMDNSEIDNNLTVLFKLVHVTSFNVALQVLMLLNQVVDSRDDIIHRYYNALYRKMLDLEWRKSAKQTFFLNLMFNSLIKDDALPRIKAFVKRLLQAGFAQNVPFVCGSLILISELTKTKKNLFQLDHSMLTANKLNDALAAAKKGKFDDDDDEERFYDVKASDEEDDDNEEDEKYASDKDENGKRKLKAAKNKNKAAAVGSWVHKRNIIFKHHDRYDPKERNPLYAGADKTLTYEMLLFKRHYHPTVVVFANKLLDDEPINYGGDPMEDFTLIHFLDRFVYKNPKKEDKKSRKSVFEPNKTIKPSKISKIPINSKEYLNLDIKSIPEEEKFFYNYYKLQASKKPGEDMDSDDASIADSEFDDYLFKTETDGADPFMDLDFTDEINNKKSKKAKKGAKEDEDQDEDEDDGDGDFGGDDDDDDVDESLVDEFDDDEDFENELEGEFDEDDEDDELNSPNEDEEDMDDDLIMMQKPKRKRGKEDLAGLFAAADEFSDLINESASYDKLGVGTISNKDNSDAKQLRWEMDRDAKFRRGGGGGGRRGGHRHGKSGGGRSGPGGKGKPGKSGPSGGGGGKKKPGVGKSKGGAKRSAGKKPAKSGAKKTKRRGK